MTQYKEYCKPATQLLRPYVPGEDLTEVAVSAQDLPSEGGMIAVNRDNPKDMWYVNGDFFTANYVLADEDLLPNTWRQRIITELTELDKKANALSEFIGHSGTFDALDPAEQERLKEQNDIMRQYSEILKARIFAS